jgi:3-keto-disaccharide hydrolase
MSRQAARAGLACVAVLVGAAALRVASADADEAKKAAPAKAASAAWKPLFEGTTITAWRGYKSPDVPAGWTVKDGVVTKEGRSGDLVSKDQYGDFELEFEWKLASGGNAGVFYHGTEEYDHIYWSGPEYQLLDDAVHADGKNRLTAAGSAYALYAPPAGVVKPAGEWNASKIVVKGAHVEHWLNGQKVVDYMLWSPDWETKVKASKFKDYPNYGKAKTGYIGIQGDHEGMLQLRNVRIREL